VVETLPEKEADPAVYDNEPDRLRLVAEEVLRRSRVAAVPLVENAKLLAAKSAVADIDEEVK
jgi:hypothetical protein